MTGEKLVTQWTKYSKTIRNYSLKKIQFISVKSTYFELIIHSPTKIKSVSKARVYSFDVFFILNQNFKTAGRLAESILFMNEKRQLYKGRFTRDKLFAHQRKKNRTANRPADIFLQLIVNCRMNSNLLFLSQLFLKLSVRRTWGNRFAVLFKLNPNFKVLRQLDFPIFFV